MDFTKFNPAMLRELIKLSEQKEALQVQIANIDKRITALASGKTVSEPVKRAKRDAAAPKVKEPKAKKAGKTGGKRGALKQQIVDLLHAAGPSGIAVKEIAEKLGVKNQNVHVWFSTTGKKLSEIEKVGEARYAIGSSAPATSTPAAEPEPASEAAPAPTASLSF